MTTIKLKTWYCPACPYHQDYDPADEELHAVHYPDVPATRCPACFYGRNPERVQRESDLLVQDDPDKQVSINIIGEEEIAQMEVPTEERDENEKVIMRPLNDDEKVEERRKMQEALNACNARRA